MAHIGIERFGPGDAEEHRAQNIEPGDAMAKEKRYAKMWAEGPENAQVIADVQDAQHGDDHKPDDHDRPEEFRDAASATALHRKQDDHD
jgi:hypothetical protein